MGKRPCVDCGALTTATRCPPHAKANARQRQTKRDQRRAVTDPTHRARHRQARAAWAPRVATGTVACYRCGQAIIPGTPWDIDQTPVGWHPSHANHNRAAGARQFVTPFFG